MYDPDQIIVQMQMSIARGLLGFFLVISIALTLWLMSVNNDLKILKSQSPYKWTLIFLVLSLVDFGSIFGFFYLSGYLLILLGMDIFMYAMPLVMFAKSIVQKLLIKLLVKPHIKASLSVIQPNGKSLAASAAGPKVPGLKYVVILPVLIALSSKIPSTITDSKLMYIIAPVLACVPLFLALYFYKKSKN